MKKIFTNWNSRQLFNVVVLFYMTAVFFGTFFVSVQKVSAQDVLFVSPNGNDGNDGLSEQKSVATIAKGLEIARAKKMKRIAIQGRNRIEQPIILSPDDSGMRFFGNGIIDGSRVITDWKPYKNGIWQAEIPETKSGEWSFRQIYINGQLRHRAKTPNEGFYRVAGCPEGTPKTVNYHTDCRSFEFKSGDIDPNWKNLNEINVVVYYFWSDNHLPIESVDAEKKIVRFKHKGGKTFTDDFSEEGARYFVENLFEALDQPGEWYLNKTEGILYYMPFENEDLTKTEVVAPYAKGLLQLNGDPLKGQFVKNIQFENITFQYCNFELPAGNANDQQGSSSVVAAINLTGAQNNQFSQCTFSNFGTYGLELKSGCSENSVTDCRFENLAAGAIRINGGNAGSNPLTHTKNNRIIGNEIAHYGKVYPSAVGIISQHSYGNVIAQNHIHHGYYTGVSIGWVWGYGRSISRDNLVESNHIHHIGQGLLSDMGGIYTLGVSYGTIIRNNLIHDIDANKYGGWGIYNDEGSTGILVEKNIVYNTKFAGYDMHYGKEIVIRNNIFALGKIDQINRTRGENHTSLFFENNIVYWKDGTLFSHDWNDKEYRYSVHPNQKEGEKRTRNFESNWNIFYNPNQKTEEIKFGNGSFEAWQKRGYDQNSIIADPLFVDPDHFNFQLKPESPALKRGFEQIDLKSIKGLP
ncbi:MAG: right-handed parallel beta-helix repeat-containing protein [Planctomycetaceae bacterium]|nr:right-handed parallel beta-helix repeat-containing protein [Planctomycetaceae bacterium]